MLWSCGYTQEQLGPLDLLNCKIIYRNILLVIPWRAVCCPASQQCPCVMFMLHATQMRCDSLLLTLLEHLLAVGAGHFQCSCNKWCSVCGITRLQQLLWSNWCVCVGAAGSARAPWCLLWAQPVLSWPELEQLPKAKRLSPSEHSWACSKLLSSDCTNR